ncbi:TIGR04222 domain-containing membrane protein [Gordonia polyisoprenivorans]|uniref:TIGR04222 domain-containing membrane protein n=1 Tax=Gordonia polyisoprenivorans TaxID=84595 RepID=UPI0019E6604E|nr:TIGR04222 domain-containing membrane protein [Gordonia polyisoprenivorans]MBE7193309.1 TIGR04222 domain-containing membrane protein [Gordonia polyisoprenivorans]UZF55033.1 TIGR04222 domain-containing membrane protein [Gordonia polyisoprenivorans]WCB36207.1 TIGR04222 domain-containing membrane protein [Gordonia polyisoprenivorans]
MNGPDTWGIPSTTFLALYAVISVAALAVVIVRRRPAHQLVDDLPDLTPTQIGALVSEENAVLAAVAQLRAAGYINSSGRVTNRLKAAPAQNDRFVRAVGDRYARRGTSSLRDVSVPLRQVHSELIDVGLRHARRRAVGVAVLIPVLVLGLARIVAGLAHRKPVGYLVVIVICLAAVCIWCAVHPRERTARGEAVLAELRRRHRLLAPQYRPALATLGAHHAAVAAALHGIEALALLDPRLAADPLLRPTTTAPDPGIATPTTPVVRKARSRRATGSGGASWFGSAFYGGSDGGSHHGGSSHSCGGGWSGCNSGGSSCGGGGGGCGG